MPNFIQTISPTPFGFFDADTTFQSEADSMVVFVKRKLGDDILSVELTKKQIWSCFEEACLEYSRLIHEMRIKSDLVHVLGLPTGSNVTNVYPRSTLEFLIRLTEPYGSIAGVGGSYDLTLSYFDLEVGRQDYDIYSELRVANGSNAGSLVTTTMPSGSEGKIRVVEVFHFEPTAAQSFLLNASNVTNFLATNFNYESYVNSTVFYVLPVFEDVLRRSMLETAFRVRRSHYSYQIIGRKVRIFPIPSSDLQTGKLYLTVAPYQQNPLVDASSGVSGSISFNDSSLSGISGPNNVPFDNLPFSTINQPGRQWIRQLTLALCKELLGLIRSKFDSVPIPNAELKLNGAELVQQGREDKEKLITQMKEFLLELTRDKLIEKEVSIAENLQKQLRTIPMPLGKSIVVG
jgi:hypothetical protein